jgi:16S rRNA (guanine527-N7)-methyltransferase
MFHVKRSPSLLDGRSLAMLRDVPRKGQGNTRWAARLDELCAAYGIAHAREPLEALLRRLSGPEAPTAVHSADEGVDVHIADSLVALDLEAIRGAGMIADLGSGAGLPGLVLAAALPQSQVRLVESAGKKCRFIDDTAAAMTISNVAAVWSRAEAWSDGMGACDVVCARALASLPVLCEYAAPLLRDGGTFVAWKGAVEPDEARDGRAAAEIVGLEASEVRDVRPYGGSTKRQLHVFRKVSETPSRFPRREGMATKRPLSATS